MKSLPNRTGQQCPRPPAAGADIGAPSWTRRAFLAGLATLGGGALLGVGLLGRGVGAPMSVAGPVAAAGAPDAPGPGSQPPFSLAAHSELSEDYFLVENHPVDPAKDTVVAYSRSNGTVEGIVLQDGVIRQVYRDDAQPGGWNVLALPDAAAVTSMVAGMSGPIDLGGGTSAAALKVFYTRFDVKDTLFVAVETPPAAPGSAPTYQTTSVPWSSTAGHLQLSVNFDNSLLVCAMIPSAAIGNPNARLYFYADGTTTDRPSGRPTVPATGFLTGFDFVPPDAEFAQNKPGFTARWSAVVAKPDVWTGQPTLLLGLPHDSYGPVKALGLTVTPPSVNLWSFPLKSGTTDGAPMTSYALEHNGFPPASPSGMSWGYSVEAMTTLGSESDPTLVVRTLDIDGWQKLWVVSPTDQSGGWTWTELTLPGGRVKTDPMTFTTAIRPMPDTEKNTDSSVPAQTSFLDMFVVTGNTLSVARKAAQGDAVKDYTNPVYYPAIPLDTGVLLMTGQAGQSTGNELLVVGDDKALHALVKDPVTGHWTDAPIQLPASEAQQVSAYRTELRVVDSWGRPVGNHDLQITASTPVTAMFDGRVVALGADATTAPTDPRGRLVLTMIADGLSAPTLTVNADGLPTATINPSAGINDYLQGAAPLNYLPAFTADTLRRATLPDGSLLAPGAADQAGDQAFDNMKTAATWAGAPSLAATASHTLSQPEGRPAATAADGPGVTALTAATITTWIHDALHAIKKAAVKVQDIGYDVASRTFTIAADFTNWADQKLTIVVHGIEDAAHVLHAVLNQVGAEIVHAVEWLEAEIVSVLKDTAALARQYDDWLTQCLEFIGRELTTGATAVDAWIAGEQQHLVKEFTDLANRWPTGTTLASLPTDQPAPPPAATVGAPTAAGMPSLLHIGPHGGWLLGKVEHALLGSLNLPDLAGLQDLISGLSTAVKQAGGDFETAYADFTAFLTTNITHPDQAGTLGVRDLLLAMAKLLDGAFTLLRGAIAAVMKWFAALAGALPRILSTPLSAMPIVGEILKLAGLGSVTVGTLASMLVAFPTVVGYKIAHGGQGRPFGSSSALPQAGHTLGDVSSDLQYASGAALLVWAGFDTISAATTASQQTPSMLFSAVDIAAPLIVTLLTVPSATNGEPYFTTPVSGDRSSVLNFASWILGAIPAFAVGTSLYIDQKLKGAEDTPFWKDSMLALTANCGVASTVTGCVGNGLSSTPTGASYASSILNNVANVIAPLQGDQIVESTEGVSALVAAALTGICGFGGAVVQGVAG